MLLRAVAAFLRFTGGDGGSASTSSNLRLEEEAFALWVVWAMGGGASGFLNPNLNLLAPDDRVNNEPPLRSIYNTRTLRVWLFPAAARHACSYPRYHWILSIYRHLVSMVLLLML